MYLVSSIVTWLLHQGFMYLVILITRCYYPYMNMTMYLVGTLNLLGYLVKDCMYLVTLLTNGSLLMCMILYLAGVGITYVLN
jgi:hypothetical protein